MITDNDVKEVVTAFVDIANSTDVMKEITRNYETGGRSLGIRIVGGSKFKTGLLFKDGELKLMSALDEPTVIATLEKITFWNIINAKTAEIAKIQIISALYTEQTLFMDPPIGEGGELHFENVLKIFQAVSKEVMT